MFISFKVTIRRAYRKPTDEKMADVELEKNTDLTSKHFFSYAIDILITYFIISMNFFMHNTCNLLVRWPSVEATLSLLLGIGEMVIQVY